jgi:adenylate kinase family enzyme
MIISVFKELERAGVENVQQSEIINRMVHKIEIESDDRATSVEKSIETSKKVANVIQYLITKENVLMITQDAKVKNDRYLSLNINVDLESMGGLLHGTNPTTY